MQFHPERITPERKNAAELSPCRVVSNFVVQALRGEPLSIYGDGSQTRSFCYVSDEVDGIFRLFNSNRHEPTNVGNPVEFTIAQLAEIVVELADSGAVASRARVATQLPSSTDASGNRLAVQGTGVKPTSMSDRFERDRE